MSRSQQSERRYTAAKDWTEKQNTGFSASYLKIPQGVQMFKPKAGSMLLDILPYEAGEGNPIADKGMLHWERTFYVHRGIGANGDFYLCPRMNSKEACPICEFRRDLQKDNDPKDEKLIQDLAPKQRQVFNVINLKEPDKGVQLWEISYHLFGKTLQARLNNADEEDHWDEFYFMKGGSTLKIAFEDKSFAGANYVETAAIDFKERREDYEDEILDKVVCLDDILVEVPYEKLKGIFLQTSDKKKEDKEDKKDEAVDDTRSSRRGREEKEKEQEPEEREEREARSDRRRPARDEEEEKPARRSSREEPEDDRPARRPARDEEEEKPRVRSDDDRDSRRSREEEPPRRARREEPEDDRPPAGKDKGKSAAKEDPDEKDPWDDFDKRKKNK